MCCVSGVGDRGTGGQGRGQGPEVGARRSGPKNAAGVTGGGRRGTVDVRVTQSGCMWVTVEYRKRPMFKRDSTNPLTLSWGCCCRSSLRPPEPVANFSHRVHAPHLLANPALLRKVVFGGNCFEMVTKPESTNLSVCLSVCLSPVQLESVSEVS